MLHNGYALLLGLYFVLLFQTNAQRYVHFTEWNRLTISKEFTPTFTLALDFNYKRQNNYHLNFMNPVQNAYSEDVKLWLNFNKENWLFVVSPVSHFYNQPLLGKESDFLKKGSEEWRFAVGAEYRRFFTRWGYRARTTYELRMLESNAYVPNGRWRFRVGANYNFTEKTRLVFSNDLFINTFPNRSANVYDNDWAFLGINQAISEHLNLELGYLRATKERSTLTEFDLENAISFAMIIGL